MRKIGYARVSTSTQNLDRQIGARVGRREKAINALGRGDVLVVAEWDRATRSKMDGVHIIERIHARVP